MKCKKIFAMLLALCMVLSTFVAVSAEADVSTDVDEDINVTLDDTLDEEDDTPTVYDIENVIAPVSASTDENAIAFTTERCSNWITEDNGAYTISIADLHSKMTQDVVNAYTGFIRVVPTTPIAKDTKWVLTYDLTANDVVDPDNQGDTWLRLLDNKTTATQGKTLGYVKESVSYRDGTRTVTFDTDDMENGGAKSEANEIVAINVTLDLADVWAAYDKEANDGTITLSNFTLVAVPTSTEPDPEPGDGGDEGDDGDDDDTPADSYWEEISKFEASLKEADKSILFGGSATDNGIVADDVKGNALSAKITAAGNNGVVGVLLVDAKGNAVKSINKGDKVSVSLDVNSSVGFTAANYSGLAGILLRGGGWTPADSFYQQLTAGKTVPADTWTTISGTWTVDRDLTTTGNGFYVYFRPNVVCDVKLCNFKVTLEGDILPEITDVKKVSVGADNAVFNVETTGKISVKSLKSYCEVNGVAYSKVTAKAIDDTNTEVTVTGLAPNTEYEFELTGAKATNDKEISIAEDANVSVTFTTLSEVSAGAKRSGSKVAFSFDSNLAVNKKIYAVLLRCKGNTVLETSVVECDVPAGDVFEGELPVDALGKNEYFRFFTWTYEAGAVSSLASYINLD